MKNCVIGVIPTRFLVINLESEVRMKKEELKPCPFCGSNDIRLMPRELPSTTIYDIWCHGCLAGFPSFEVKENAVIKWNQRTSK